MRGGGRAKRTKGGGIDATTSLQTRYDCGTSKSDGNGNGNRKCRAPPSQDLVATALVLVAKAAAALNVDNADSGNSCVPIIGNASLASGGGVIN